MVVDGTDRLVEGAQVRVRKPGDVDNPSDAAGGGRSGRGSKRADRGGAGQ